MLRIHKHYFSCDQLQTTIIPQLFSCKLSTLSVLTSFLKPHLTRQSLEGDKNSKILQGRSLFHSRCPTNRDSIQFDGWNRLQLGVCNLNNLVAEWEKFWLRALQRIPNEVAEAILLYTFAGLPYYEHTRTCSKIMTLAATLSPLGYWKWLK